MGHLGPTRSAKSRNTRAQDSGEGSRALKICSKCGDERTGSGSYCKPCMAARSAAWRKAYPEKARESVRKYQLADRQRLRLNRRRSHVKSSYGITQDQYEEMLAAQSGRCAICGTDKPVGPGGVFVVDHSHATNQVRGLLCCKCNFVLGHSEDRADVLAAAISYLQKYAGR